jgi:hypothetical protein
MVGILPPIQIAHLASSSYEAKTGQSRAYFKGTKPYTVRTAFPSRYFFVKGADAA